MFVFGDNYGKVKAVLEMLPHPVHARGNRSRGNGTSADRRGQGRRADGGVLRFPRSRTR